MKQENVFVIMVGICVLVLLIGVLKQKAAIVLNLIVRVVVGCVGIILLNDFLQKQGIQTSVHYPAVHRFSVYQDLAHGDLLNTEYAADCEITLPMYGKLEKSDVMFICNAFRQILEGLQ